MNLKPFPMTIGHKVLLGGFTAAALFFFVTFLFELLNFLGDTPKLSFANQANFHLNVMMGKLVLHLLPSPLRTAWSARS
jgi:hypothetical protein